MPIATALIVAAAAYQAQKQGKAGGGDAEGDGEPDRSSSPPDIDPPFLEGKSSLELLPLEQSLNLLEYPTSTVAFYETASADATEAALEGLERRVTAILRANPWLGGWLVHGKGVGSYDTTPRLWYDPAGEAMAPGTFQRLSHDDVPLDKNTPYVDYERLLLEGEVVVKTNPEIANRKGESLFRVAVVPAPDGGGFVLVVSMSHVLGDGHTYYRIYNMLLGEPIVPLKPQRELLYGQKIMELMGRQEAYYISHITTDPAWMNLFRWGSDASAIDEEDAGSKLQGRVFFLNRHWIGNIKAADMTEGNIADVCTSTLRSPMTPALLHNLDSESHGAAGAPTHSTNDILVSWFWNLVNPDVGLMTVNFRKRLGFVTEDHAGNYANPIPYAREDYRSPALIRQSLETCRRAGRAAGSSEGTTLPRAHPELTFSVVTNWSSFRPRAREDDATEDDDEACWNDGQDVTLLRHLPVVFPGRMKDKMPKRMSFLVIFSSGEDVGCVLIAPGRAMEEIDRCGVVEEMIAEF